MVSTTIHVGGRMGGVTVDGNRVGAASSGQGHCLVGIALPKAPRIRIHGSGDVTLYGLDQPLLDVAIQGSGDVTAFGRVQHLAADVIGSGDVDARELVAESATLSIAGSGDIDAQVTRSVGLRIAGSGDIVLRGNPPHCSQSIAGSGRVRFKG